VTKLCRNECECAFTICCSILQHLYCSVLLVIRIFVPIVLHVLVVCITNDCNSLQRTATHCNTLQHVARHCKTLQDTARHCKHVSLQYVDAEPHCNALQRTATHCNILQHTAAQILWQFVDFATHCNTFPLAVCCRSCRCALFHNQPELQVNPPKNPPPPPCVLRMSHVTPLQTSADCSVLQCVAVCCSVLQCVASCSTHCRQVTIWIKTLSII